MYTESVYILIMIKSFKDKETEKVFNEEFSKKLPKNIQKIALRKLIMINSSNTLRDLMVPPSNHLEALKGDRIGQWSIRINDQWRICFVPVDNGSNYINVEIVDYH